jgi:hypothetical protein
MSDKLTQEQIEQRLGTDTQEPLVCALTGQPVQGRHSVGYKIAGTGILYRVLAKHHHLWTPETRTAFEAQAAPKTLTKPKEGDKTL